MPKEINIPVIHGIKDTKIVFHEDHYKLMNALYEIIPKKDKVITQISNMLKFCHESYKARDKSNIGHITEIGIMIGNTEVVLIRFGTESTLKTLRDTNVI